MFPQHRARIKSHGTPTTVLSSAETLKLALIQYSFNLSFEYFVCALYGIAAKRLINKKRNEKVREGWTYSSALTQLETYSKSSREKGTACCPLMSRIISFCCWTCGAPQTCTAKSISPVPWFSFEHCIIVCSEAVHGPNQRTHIVPLLRKQPVFEKLQ